MRKFIFLFSVSMILFTSCSNKLETAQLDDTTIKTVESISPTPIPSNVPSYTPTPTVEPDPIDNMDVYYEGQYKVGVDIPAGEYMVVAGDYGGYFSVTSDANGNDILFNDNFDSNSIITIYENEYLELSRCFALPVDEFYDYYTVNTDNDGVMLKVGLDIPAGEYKIDAANGSGYFCIYGDSRHDDIISNDNFNGTRYITVNEGEYLLLSRCKLVQ